MQPGPENVGAQDTLVIRPGGQGLVLDLIFWLMNQVSDQSLKVEPSGLRIGQRDLIPWSLVYAFNINKALPPLPYDKSLSVHGRDFGMLANLNLYAHYSADLLVTVLSAYKLRSLLQSPQTPDADVVESVVRLTGEADVHSLIRSFHNWTLWGLVGRHRPELVPQCLHTASVSPLRQLFQDLGSRDLAFETLGTVQESGYGSPLCESSQAWMATNWRRYEGVLNQALGLSEAERLAERGNDGREKVYFAAERTQDRGPAQITFRGKSVDLAGLLASNPTVQEVLGHLQLQPSDCGLFHARDFPHIAQGLIRLEQDGSSVWLWVDRARLKSRRARDWRVEQFLDAPVVSLEHHAPGRHSTRWKESARKYSDRVMLISASLPSVESLLKSGAAARPRKPAVTCFNCGWTVVKDDNGRCPECGETDPQDREI